MHIPKNQRTLLDENEAWSRPTNNSVAHVPSAILDGVAEAWKRSKVLTVQDDKVSNSAFQSQLNPVKAAYYSPSWGSDADEQSDDEESEPSKPGTQDMSQSPSKPHLVEVARHDMEDEDEDEEEQSEEEHGRENKKAAQDQEAEAAEEDEGENDEEAEHTHDDDNEDQQTSTLSQPTDSQAKKRSYEDSEVVPDSAQISKSYREATPPCAQADEDMIPHTIARPTTPAQAAAIGDVRRKRMKPITFSDIDHEILHAADTSLTTRMAPTKPYIETPSSNLVSSSMIPATFDEKHASAETAGTKDDHLELQSSAAKTAYDIDATMERIEAESQADEDYYESPLRSRRLEPSTYIPDKTLTEQDGDVYTAFCRVYPDYITAHRGSLIAFVNACVYLQYLTSERLLRECLFDDFIRAFSGGYQGYVAQAGAGQEPLPALEWFNNLAGRPIYNFCAMARENLHIVIQHYPEQSKAAKQLFGKSPLPGPTVVQSEPLAEVEPESMRDSTPRASSDLRAEQSERPTYSSSAALQQRSSVQSTPQKSTPLRPKTIHSSSSRSPITATVSPELGSLASHKRAAPLPAANPSPPSSRYMDRLITSSMPTKSAAPPKRSAAEQARLREHFRNRKLSGRQAPKKS